MPTLALPSGVQQLAATSPGSGSSYVDPQGRKSRGRAELAEGAAFYCDPRSPGPNWQSSLSRTEVCGEKAPEGPAEEEAALMGPVPQRRRRRLDAHSPGRLIKDRGRSPGGADCTKQSTLKWD